MITPARLAAIPDEELREELLKFITMPQPPVWPSCGLCKQAFALERVMLFNAGGVEWAWRWKPNCYPKHTKKAIKDHVTAGGEEHIVNDHWTNQT